ncbi:MAG: hypothetical protein ACI9FW_000277 [Flavobacterium sp.]|jgi:hypothetical protein
MGYVKKFRNFVKQYIYIFKMEIKDNELLRQFEITTDTGLVAIEYSLQDRKIFLTKFCENENLDIEIQDEFIKNVLAIAEERKLKVVPTNLKIIKFFRKNRRYRELLPPGLKI